MLVIAVQEAGAEKKKKKKEEPMWQNKKFIFSETTVNNEYV